MTPLSNLKTLVTADGLKIRYGVWPVHDRPGRGRVLVLAGRTEFVEKYFETIQELNQRGFSVTMFDWRGQGLSDRMLPDRRKGHVGSYDDYLRDLKQFMNEVMNPAQDPGIIVLAHSMGGHLALRFCHDYPGTIQKAVLTSPLIDIAGSRWLRAPLKILVGLAAKSGLKACTAARKNGELNRAGKGFLRNRLTRDPVRFQRTLKWLQDHPELAVDGVTFGWLQATFRSMAVLSANGYAEAIRTPILMVTAGSDRVVSVAAQQSLCDRLPHAQMVTIPEARHEILIETDDVRRAFWRVFDGFTAGDFTV